MLLKASRLYFFIRSRGGKIGPDQDFYKHAGFTKYSFQKYIGILLNEGWIRRSVHGVVYTNRIDFVLE